MRGARVDLGTAGAPSVLGGPEQGQQVGPWQVGAAPERLTVGRHEHRHGPAALPGHRGGGGHVDRVNIRALFPVDLDRHETLGQCRGHLLVLEGLVSHHVTPVASGIPHRQKDRDVAAARFGEGLLAPLPPVHGVGFVLAQVGAERARETVGHTSSVAGRGRAASYLTVSDGGVGNLGRGSGSAGGGRLRHGPSWFRTASLWMTTSGSWGVSAYSEQAPAGGASGRREGTPWWIHHESGQLVWA